MRRSTTFAACFAALAVCVSAVVTTLNLVLAAPPPGGGPGNPIYLSDLTLSLDQDGQVPVEGDYIARGQTFWVRAEDIYDEDTLGDPTIEMDEIVSAVWTRRHRPLGGSWGSWESVSGGTLEHKGNNHYRSVLEQSFDTDGDYEYKLTVNDEGHPGNDAEVSKTKHVEIRGVDYVVVRDNPSSVTVAAQVTLTGTAYDDVDGVRHFDEHGEEIPGTDADVVLAGAFVWCVWGPNIGAVSPSEGTSTVFTAGMTAGQCFVRATFDGPGVDDVYGDAQVIVTSPAGYWIDLKGVNYEDVQNVPINAWAPAARDGTGDVGQTKAKVVITGEPDTEYDVTISAPSDLRLNGAVGDLDFSLTTDGQGAAEQEFEIHAEPLSPTPSESLEDLTLSASMFPSGESTACAVTTEQITLYQFSFQDPPEITATAGGTSSGGGARYDEDAFQCWTGSGAAAATCHSHMWKVAELRVLCEPTGAFGGSVTAEAEVEFHKWCYAKLGKARAEVGGESSLTVSYGIVSMTWTASGSHHRAGVAMDQSVQFETGPLRDAGEWPHDTSEFTVSPLYDYDDKEWDHDDAMIEFDLPRSYQVGGSGHDVTLGICIVAKTTHPYVSPPPSAYGAEVLDSSYIDSMERSTDGIHVYEHDSVFEIE